ncbi:MAG: hypothetical protein E4H01_14180 [Lysobacterales bacterium]|nr:MAG: hypothetical protein E4H01_14180 [Xanthomonadales bacterium]
MLLGDKMNLRLGLLIPILFSCAVGAASAQTLPMSGRTPVPSNIIGEEYAAKGMPVGAFRLYPTLTGLVGTDDNVFRTDTETVSDTFFVISPRLSLETQSEGHFFALRGGVDVYEFADSSSESRTDWFALAEGGTEVVQGTRIFGSVGYRDTHEPRGYFDEALSLAEPTPFSVFHADARIESKPNRFGVAIGVGHDSTNYQNSKLIGLGTASNDDRDFDQFELFGRLSYEFSPGYALYTHAAYNTRNFDLALDRNGVNRDSTGYRVNAGVQMEVTRLIVGEAYVGYLQQDYDAPLSNESGFNFGANILWSPSQTVDVRLGAAHNIVETVVSQDFVPATASNQQAFTLGIDYAIRPNVILNGDVGYLHNVFTGTSRTDDTTTFGAGATYLINSYLSASAGYEHSNRDSTTVGQNYSDNIFWFSLGFQV